MIFIAIVIFCVIIGFVVRGLALSLFLEDDRNLSSDNITIHENNTYIQNNVQNNLHISKEDLEKLNDN